MTAPSCRYASFSRRSGKQKSPGARPPRLLSFRVMRADHAPGASRFFRTLSLGPDLTDAHAVVNGTLDSLLFSIADMRTHMQLCLPAVDPHYSDAFDDMSIFMLGFITYEPKSLIVTASEATERTGRTSPSASGCNRNPSGTAPDPSPARASGCRRRSRRRSLYPARTSRRR